MVLGEGTVRWWWGKHICRAVCKNKLSVTSSALKGGSAGWFVEYFALKLKIFSKIIILANNSLDKHDAETLNPDHSGDSLVLLNWNNRLEALPRSQQLDWLSMLAEMCYGGKTWLLVIDSVFFVNCKGGPTHPRHIPVWVAHLCTLNDSLML